MNWSRHFFVGFMIAQLPPACLSDFEADCANLISPLYGFYDRGTCYVIDTSLDSNQPWETKNAACTHMSDNGRGGLAMWLPSTVSNEMHNRLISVDKWMLIGLHSPTETIATQIAQEQAFSDELLFGQSVDFSPSWISKSFTNGLFVFNAAGSSSPQRFEGRLCAYYNPYVNTLGSNLCDVSTETSLQGLVCEYQPSRTWSLKSFGHFKLPVAHVVETHLVNSAGQCLKHLAACRACHSASVSATVCELYISDDRLATWDAIVIADEDFTIWKYI